MDEGNPGWIKFATTAFVCITMTLGPCTPVLLFRHMKYLFNKLHYHVSLLRVLMIGVSLAVFGGAAWGSQSEKEIDELLGNGFQNLHDEAPEKAITHFEAVLEADGDHVTARYGKAMALFKLDRYDEVNAILDVLLSENPRNLDALNLRALTYYNLHKFDEAIEDFQLASEIDPEEGYFHECIAWSYLCSGEPERASREALRASALYRKMGEDPSFSLVVAYLGFREAGNHSEADKVLRYAADAMDPLDWPFPVVEYFNGVLDENRLIVEVNNLYEETEARTYIAIKKFWESEPEMAKTYLEWVSKKGESGVFEHTYAKILHDRISRL